MTASENLRNLVKIEISSNPEFYEEAILGKSICDYVDWITNPASWGGEIEISILSKHFKVVCYINSLY